MGSVRKTDSKTSHRFPATVSFHTLVGLDISVKPTFSTVLSWPFLAYLQGIPEAPKKIWIVSYLAALGFLENQNIRGAYPYVRPYSL